MISAALSMNKASFGLAIFEIRFYRSLTTFLLIIYLNVIIIVIINIIIIIIIIVVKFLVSMIVANLWPFLLLNKSKVTDLYMLSSMVLL